MNTQTIDHSTLSRLVEAGAVRDTHVVGRQGGWSIQVQTDKATTVFELSVARKGTRLFKKMDTLISYLNGLGLSKFEVDAAGYMPQPYSRPDRSEAMKQTHEAAAHNKWFREQVREAVREADAPDAVWISNEDAKKDWAALRTELLARAKGGGERA